MKILLKNIRTFLVIFFSLVITSMIFLGCSINSQKEEDVSDNKKPVVAVSIVPQDTFVKAVAGDLVDTIVLVPPGNSPTNYSPSPGELEQLSQSSIYFTIGIPTETANIIPRIGNVNKDIKIIDLAAEVNRVYPDREFASGKRDPHIWLSPKRVQVMIDKIAKELAEIDPKNQTVYEVNAAEYKNKLEQLDDNISNIIQKAAGRTFIVYHPAFGYFADDYQLDMVTIEKDGKTATAKDIENIIDFAREQEVKIIFYQSSITSRQADTIAAEIGGHTKVLDPLAADYIENMEIMAKSFTNAIE
jgi:zinc transport system substrate-binding protein